jgi:hypothetical protein
MEFLPLEEQGGLGYRTEHIVVSNDFFPSPIWAIRQEHQLNMGTFVRSLEMMSKPCKQP